MKATGIIRRIDDLGRVVIPKEIRRNLGIHEGDPLEIYTEGRDTVCFRKYEVNLRDEINHLATQIETYYDLPHETQAKIDSLLDEVWELVAGEEE
jgi:stage V sporulation protein T